MAPNAWDLIRTGDIRTGLARMRRDFEAEPDASRTMELGVAYLWLREYRAAADHFDEANRKRPGEMSTYYEMAGTAQWCLRQPEKAVAEWLKSTECEYVDVAGGVTPALLLYFASTYMPVAYDRAATVKMLEARARDERATMWPGPIAAYLAGLISLDELERGFISTDESDTALRHWQAGFYLALGDHEVVAAGAFALKMRQTSTVTDMDFDPSYPDYLTKLWHSEFFLARSVVDARLDGVDD